MAKESQKVKIVNLLKEKDGQTQADLARAIYLDDNHSTAIHTALMKLIREGMIKRNNQRPCIYYLVQEPETSEERCHMEDDETDSGIYRPGEVKFHERTVINATELHGVLEDLASMRPIFHSEADFQLAFGRLLEAEYHKVNASVRLEYPVYIVCKPYERAISQTENGALKSNYRRIGNELKVRRYLDVLVVLDDKMYPIELKYKTDRFDWTCDGVEEYHLAHVGAEDNGGYDLWNDVWRIEKMKKELSSFERGYTICITNSMVYRNRNPRDNTNYIEFGTWQGRKNVAGKLSWRETDANGDKIAKDSIDSHKDRRDCIELDGSYDREWMEYSNLSNGDINSNGRFIYSLEEII